MDQHSETLRAHADGHFTQIINCRGVETRYEYDAQAREIVKREAYGTSIEAKTETGYDDNGNVVEVRSPRYFDSADTEGYQKAKENWTYDGARRVLNHTEATGSSVAANGTVDLMNSPIAGLNGIWASDSFIT